MSEIDLRDDLKQYLKQFLYLFGDHQGADGQAEKGLSAWEILHRAFRDMKFEPNRTEDERKQALADFLNADLFLSQFEAMDRQYSQRKHAKARGFDAGSFNNWINANRLPDGDNLFQLALVYGPIVYDIIGVRAASNMLYPRTRLALEYFGGSDDEGKREALRKLKSIHDRSKGKQEIDNLNPTTA